MKFADIITKTEKELIGLLAEHRVLLRELKSKASEGQLKEVRKIRETRKVISRILTALGAKQTD